MEIFFSESERILGRTRNHNAWERTFRSNFGICTDVAWYVWVNLNGLTTRKSHPKHFLMSLYFLKTYSTENVIASYFNVDEKTARFWIWEFIQLFRNNLDEVRCFF